MTIEIKTVIKYEYKCNACANDYIEQRNPGENAFFTKCTVGGCNGIFELVNQTEFTYEQEVPDPVIEEEAPTE
jgi:hypothetical protein